MTETAARESIAPSPSPPGDATLLSASSRRLAVLTAALLAAPLIVGGLWADLLGGASGPALEGALRVQLALLAWVLPALWTALAPAPVGHARADLARTAADLGLLVACAAPFLALAAPFAALAPAATAAGIVHALALLASVGVWLALGGPSAVSSRVALVAAWTAALPLLVIVVSDQAATGDPVGLAWLAPPLGQLAALERGLGPAALLGAALPPLALALAARRRARAPAMSVVAALVALAVLASTPALADPRVERADAVLRDAARPGEPWPVWLEVTGADEVAAGARTRVVAPVTPAGSTLVPALPLGGGPVDVSARGEGGWERLDADLPAPRPLRAQELLIAHLGPRVGSLASALAGVRRAALVPLSPRDAPALGAAGQAVDLVVVARGQTTDPTVALELQRYAAAGGVVAFDHKDDLPRVAGALAAPGRTRGPWVLRPIGAGLLVGPAPGELGLVVPEDGARSLERLALRLRARARREALADALVGASAPAASIALGRRVALAAAGAALGLALIVLAAARLRRAAAVAAALLAGAVLTATLPPLVAPTRPVWGAAAVLYEAPAGASAAGRVEALALAAPRAVEADVRLAWGGLPLPRLGPGAALDEATITPGDEPALRAPVGPAPRAFVRVDAVGLARPDGTPGGAFTLTRGRAGQAIRIENATNWALDRVLAVTERGVYSLGVLPSGAVLERDLDLLVPPVPFARWRLGADAPGGDPDADDRAWRALVTTALAGRDLAGQLVLVGRGPPEQRVVAGVAEPVLARPLVVVTASDETSPPR